MLEIKKEDDGRKGRYALYTDDDYAGEMTFTWAGEDKFIIDHTGVEEGFGGKGFGKMLVMEAVKFARAEGLKILPLCPFAKAEFDKNQEINDVRF